jgi:hypothetical protein
MKKTASKSKGKLCCGMKKCSDKMHEKMESKSMKKKEAKRGYKS